MDNELIPIADVCRAAGYQYAFTDNEIELLRRLVKDRVEQLEDLPKWATVLGGDIAAKKLPLTRALLTKIGEPDYTKEIY